MVKCKFCDEKSVYEHRCKKHFCDYIEKKILETVERFDLIKPNEKVAVAVSGGKDSLTLLYVLSKNFVVDAIAIDEGISGYRDKTLVRLKNFCKANSINLKVFSFESVLGKKLDSVVFKVSNIPCTTCGVIRRNLINKYSKGYEKIATGHNLDDESQTIVMNLLKGQPELIKRGGIESGICRVDGFTQRIKPLYFIKEKEVAVYAFLNGFLDDFEECPYSNRSFRARVRDAINEYESKHPKVKENIVKKFFEMSQQRSQLNKDKLVGSVDVCLCEKCGSPSSNKICRSCKIIDSLA